MTGRRVGESKTAAQQPAPPIPLNLRRERPEEPRRPRAEAKEPPAITAGPIDRVTDLIFNPSRDKIREVTVIDRIQGRLLPQLDIIDLMWQYIIEIATYRQDAVNYALVYGKDRPEPPNLHGEFTYRSAQWQKSVGGSNLKSGVDITLAEIETRSDEGGEPLGGHGFDED